MEKAKNKITINRILVSLALSLSFLAAVTGDPLSELDKADGITIDGRFIEYIAVTVVADWIIEKRDDFILLDLRDSEKFIEYHIPTSKKYSDTYVKSDSNIENRKIIILTESEELPESIISSNVFKYGNVYLLKGGMDDWISKIIFPDLTLIRNPTEEKIKKIERTSRYFGGNPKRAKDLMLKSKRRYSREGC